MTNEKIGLPIKIKKSIKKSRTVKKKVDQELQKEDLFETREDHLFEKEEKQKYDEIIRDYYIKIERDKSLIMWSGVTFFMVLIVSLWVYNTRLTFQKISRESSPMPEFEFYQLADDIGDKMGEIEEKLNEIKEEETVNVETEESTSQESDMLPQTEEKDASIEELKDVLEKNLEKTN